MPRLLTHVDGRWLTHVRTVLAAAWTVAVKAHTQQTPILVHCSHGWDRTSQVARRLSWAVDPPIMECVLLTETCPRGVDANWCLLAALRA